MIEEEAGVLRIQVPISVTGPSHVNIYAAEDERGGALIDPGLPGPASWRSLTERMANAGLRVADVHTVVVTHAHSDHFGNAGCLAEEAGAELVPHSPFRTWWSPQLGDPCDEVHDLDPEDL